MDTSETYIKMRLATIPDLGMGTPPELILNIEVTWLTTFVFVDRVGNVYYSDRDQACQLERQDQLQEMIDIPEDSSYKALRLAHRFWFFVNRSPLISRAKYTPDWANTLELFTSMEQLWLAFVMKENRNKVWNGTEWIKE